MKKEKLTLEETFTLAFQNHEKNNFPVAEKLYKQILEREPNHFNSNFLLGSLLAQSKKLKPAVILLQNAIQINPNSAKAYNNLGMAFKDLGESHKAIDCYKKAIQVQPNYTKAYNNLGVVFEELAEYEKAKSYYEQEIKINPNFANSYYNLGNVLEELCEYQKAIISYKKTIKIQPDHINAHNNLALVFKSLGEYQQAIDCYENAIKYKSDNLKSVYYLSELKKEVLDLNLKKRIIKITNKDNCTKENHIYGNLLLSKYELKNSNYEKEFNYLLKTHSNFPVSNKDLFYREVDIWINKLPRLIESINFRKSNKNYEKNDDKIKPIFIVGVPRCGSTLIEKVVASGTKHIPIGEETDVLRNLVAQMIKQNSFSNLDIKDLKKKIIKKFYQKELIQEKYDYIFTDKSLDNFFYIGLIYEMFPNAKVINCKRDPLSQIMSIFKTIFRTIPWGHDLEHIFKYMDIYHGMIKNYKRKFPNLIYDLDYQDFVNNPEAESKKLLKFCNLPWDKKCLEYYKRKDIISKTASKLQIKNAIYKDSRNKYLPYKEFLYKYRSQYDWFK